MPFDYEQMIWGKDTASTSWSSPTAFRLRQALKALEDLRGPEPKILEVGCGAGQFIRALKNTYPSWRCFGCDISATALEQARAISDDITYTHCADAALPYQDGEFDAIVVFDVLEHAAEPTGLIKEIRRVLKSGGIFYCFIPCEGDRLSFWHWLNLAGIGRGLTERYAGHINRFSRWRWRELLRQAGFEELRARYSEHLLGQWLGVIVFFLLDRRSKLDARTINNESFCSRLPRKGVLGQLRQTINFLINLESRLLSRVPSPNLHLVLKKSAIGRQ